MTRRRNPDAMDQLARAAAAVAMRAATTYLRKHDLTAEPEALAATLRSWIKIKLPEALRDARAACDARMGAVAEQTFAASMALAGIEAAKEAGFPRRQNPARGRRIAQITRVEIAGYPDTGQVIAHVSWVDQRGASGVTSGDLTNAHMRALIARARREGAPIRHR